MIEKRQNMAVISGFNVHLAQIGYMFFVESDKFEKKYRKLWKFAKSCSIIVTTLLINYLNISKY